MEGTIQTSEMAKGRCQLLEMPNEILLHIVDLIDLEDGENGEDLPVSLACRRLRESFQVSCSLNFVWLKINFAFPHHLDLLRARADDPAVAPAVRELCIYGDLRTLSASLDDCLDSLHHALHRFPGLLELSLPPCFLTKQTLEVIRSSPTIGIVSIDGTVARRTLPVDFMTPPSSSSPLPRPLAFKLTLDFEVDGFSSELHSHFDRFGDVVISVDVSIPSFLSSFLRPPLPRRPNSPLLA
ncbi:hypothetical protein BDY24DRAFT_371652 [Mrakia frigida]|uniref:uncharacterized protein n=1 Tax=Mrakia frigida TaxID=29902 RepID=UPI003FCBFE4A